MNKIILSIFSLAVFFGINTSVSASTIKVNFTVNGQDESVPVELGDVLRVSWTSEGSEPVKGCSASGGYGVLTRDGAEWVGSSLPTSGTAELKVIDWNATGMGFSVYCWLGDWPQNAQFGSNIGQGVVQFLDKRVGTKPTGSVPVIMAMVPSSGPVGTRVQIIGSGFTNDNNITFVGSTNSVSGATSNNTSPINGETSYDGVASLDGKTLSFTIPSSLEVFSEKTGTVTSPRVIPGIYYVVVQTGGWKSGVSYFKVTSPGEVTNFTAPVTSLILNRNITLGDLGAEVTKLQGLLSKDPSIYPEGLVTGYFGSLTQKAVQRFQCKYGITCSGTSLTSGYGSVDLKTRLKIEEVFGEVKTNNSQINVSASISTSTNSQNKQASQNKANEIRKQIQQLQEQLRLLGQ